MPPESVRPTGTEEAGEIAAETAFQPSKEKLEVSKQALEVQVLEFSIPPDADVTGLTFVMRSADNSAWFRDGGFLYRVRRNKCPKNNENIPMNWYVNYLPTAVFYDLDNLIL